MPNFKPKAKKKIKMNESSILTLDNQHSDKMNEFKQIELIVIPNLKKERKECFRQIYQEPWIVHGPLLRAGVLVAMRAPDAEVLDVLEVAARAENSIPAGVSNKGDPYLPEWREFLDRMASSEGMGASGGGLTPIQNQLTVDRRRWRAYRDVTIDLFRDKVASMTAVDIDSKLERCGLPMEVEDGEELEAKKARLLAFMLAHPAYSTA